MKQKSTSVKNKGERKAWKKKKKKKQQLLTPSRRKT